MDRSLAFEEHLLKRSFSHNATIQTLLTTRYRGLDDGTEAYLALVPTVAPDGAPVAPKPKTDFLANTARKPSASRRLGTRQALKVYVKSTLATQRRVAKNVSRARKLGRSVSIPKLVLKHQIPSYATFEGLHEMWRGYMQDLLFGDNANPNLQMVLPRLSTADYNGCRVTVLESRDRNLVRMSGIVLLDTQHSFVLVVPQKEPCGRTLSASEELGGLRVVAKVGTLFGFDVPLSASESVGFTIIGSRFQLRSVDRSAKKFKSHRVDRIC